MKEVELQLENTVLNLYAMYKSQLDYTSANLLLETEEYEEAKKTLKGVENATLLLTDAYNNSGLIESYELESGQNSVYLELNELNSGMYVLSIKIYEEVYASTNLIVIN